MVRNFVGVFVCGLALFGAGCAAPKAIGPALAGHAIILPGIGGNNPAVARLAKMINNEVEDLSAEVWDWTRIEPTTILGDLVDAKRNRRRAKVLAGQLLAWRRNHPNARLYVTAHSGGAGIVLLACETLPADFKIERIVFLAAALSPQIDLSRAIQRSRRGVFNYYSSKDSWVLGLGTRLFGTTDRAHSKSAGLVGFDLPDDPRLAAKLEQLAWEPSMRKSGNRGGHMGAFAPLFIRTHLLPLFELGANRQVEGNDPWGKRPKKGGSG